MSTVYRTAKQKADALKAAKLKASKKKAAAKPKVSAKPTVVKTLAKTAAPSNVKQKNVTKVVQLKNKSSLTTLKGGRQVQQAPGKSAYVTKAGAGAPSGVGKPNGTSAAKKALASRNATTNALIKKNASAKKK